MTGRHPEPRNRTLEPNPSEPELVFGCILTLFCRMVHSLNPCRRCNTAVQLASCICQHLNDCPQAAAQHNEEEQRAGANRCLFGLQPLLCVVLWHARPLFLHVSPLSFLVPSHVPPTSFCFACLRLCSLCRTRILTASPASNPPFALEPRAPPALSPPSARRRLTARPAPFAPPKAPQVSPSATAAPRTVCVCTACALRANQADKHACMVLVCVPFSSLPLALSTRRSLRPTARVLFSLPREPLPLALPPSAVLPQPAP
jgi:hypothetical protein